MLTITITLRFLLTLANTQKPTNIVVIIIIISLTYSFTHTYIHSVKITSVNWDSKSITLDPKQRKSVRPKQPTETARE